MNEVYMFISIYLLTGFCMGLIGVYVIREQILNDTMYDTPVDKALKVTCFVLFLTFLWLPSLATFIIKERR